MPVRTAWQGALYLVRTRQWGLYGVIGKPFQRIAAIVQVMYDDMDHIIAALHDTTHINDPRLHDHFAKCLHDLWPDHQIDHPRFILQCNEADALRTSGALPDQHDTSQFYVLPTHTQHYSSVIGRPHWGMKRPACDLSTLRMLRSLMPSARTVYIYRNIFDCIRSAKARQFVASTDDIREMVLDWRNNIIDIEQADAEDKIILIKYEDLTANPESQLARLEKETGLRGIDRGVMAVKVNTWTGSDSGKGLAPDQYIPPAEIDEAERTLIRETAGDLLVRLYPGA